MKHLRLIHLVGCCAFLVFLTGCATKPYDYSAFRAHPPRSILVLPPLNLSTDVRATYGYLSTVSRPLAEMGYYVFPVAVVDQFMKENGLPTSGEMHQTSLQKIHEILGADAVLYVTVTQYGSKYIVVNSVTTVAVVAKLVDVDSGATIWTGKGLVQHASSSGNGIADLVVAALDQVINSATDQAHNLSPMVNAQMLMNRNQGLLPGPYFPVKK